MENHGSWISNSIPYQAHLKNKCLLESKRSFKNAVKSQEVIFQKSQKLFTSQAQSSAWTKASTAVTLPAIVAIE